MLGRLNSVIAAVAMLVASGCAEGTFSQPSQTQAAIAEVNARTIAVPDYPRANRTYLSFSRAHGFQVNFIGSNGRAWLWYPGNPKAIPETYKFETVNGIEALCWRHPENSFNPVTQTTGGDFKCEPLDFARRTIIAELAGDRFDLAEGAVPYRLERCAAPQEFEFNRRAYGC